MEICLLENTVILFHKYFYYNNYHSIIKHFKFFKFINMSYDYKNDK